MIQIELLCIALIIDAALGEPDWLWTRLPHPAKALGWGIDWLDQKLNSGLARRAKGIVACAVLVVAAGVLGQLIAFVPDFGVLECLGAAILLAHRSLIDHVQAVSSALGDNLEAGRKAVSWIVGRDVDALDESSVSRAAIESASENFSDGVIAPAFWFLIFGLPGIIIYKAVNTADSMIGHLNERYAEFGWAAAKLDDVLNWIPARLTAAWICLVYRSREAWETVTEDADLHRSPNAGWPEAAMAGVLQIALSGPRSYNGALTRDAFVNASGRRVLTRGDIDRAVGVLWRSWAAMVAALAVVSIVIILLF